MSDEQTTQKLMRKLLAVCSNPDDDESAIKAAADLADIWQADLSILLAVDRPAELSRMADATGVSTEELEQRLLDQQRESLASMIERVLPGRDPNLQVSMGTRFIDIIRKVIEEDIDLVVKAAEELHGIHRYLFASTDQHLLRKCPCPVWLRLNDSAKSVNTVLAAVDVDEAMANEPETLADLNRRIMETAQQIAGSTGADLHILHVWDAPGEGLVRLWSDAADSKAVAAAYVAEVQSTHWKSLQKLVEKANESADALTKQPVKMEIHLERGKARDVIPEQVHKLKTDILVMGTIARTGVPGFIIGNTAEDILNSVDCSVVTVKPSSYISPVAGMD
ncbi:MAG: universal stress protein [Alphaproteobacteria bacterium]